MANTIIVDDEILTSTVIDAMQQLLLPLRAFATNLSGERHYKGKKLDVKVHNKPLKSQRFGGGVDYHTIGDLNQSEVQVALDTHLIQSYALSDAEQSAGGIQETELMNRATRLGEDIMEWLTNKFLIADFPNELLGAPTAFDSDDVATLRGEAQELGWTARRALLVNSKYYTNLIKDPSLKSFFNSNDDQILREGRVPRISGFDIYEAPILSTNNTDFDGNVNPTVQNLGGLALDQRSLAVAGGMIIPGDASELVLRHTVITEPMTGLSIGARTFYSTQTGRTHFVLETLMGAVKGKADAAIRLKSA